MFYLIFGVILFLICMVILGFVADWDDEHIAVSSCFSIVISCWIILGVFFYIDRKETNQCLEKNLLIVPKIIYTSDSSRKILQYSFEDKVREIELKKENSDYYIPENLLLIEPCLNKIKIKK